jgi:hypothetical protein
MVFSNKLKRLVPVPCHSKNFAHALRVGLPKIKEQWGKRVPIGDKEHRIHIKALFLAGKGAVPDLDGCLVGCGDLLQRAGVLSNDRWIRSWDGSRIIEWREHGKEESTVVKINLYEEE